MKNLEKLAKILEGISSLMSLYPKENNRKITLPPSSTCGALKKDWENVGHDMWKVCREVETQHIEFNKDKNGRFNRPQTHSS